MTQAKILLVDDDDTLRTVLGKEISRRGYKVLSADSVASALEKARNLEVHAALVDINLPDGSGLEIVRWLNSERPNTQVIVLTGHGTVDNAIEAMRGGAFDYLRKPCSTDEIEVTIERALEHRRLIERNLILSDGYSSQDMGAQFVGRSPQFNRLKELIAKVAATDSSMLILGETGVGKDVVANLIHARSDRRDKPWVVVECAALQEDLLHSELFGHEKGSFTGALQSKHGLFEVADGGTVFLDEIGDVSLATQVKLLRVLETGRFRHVGGTKEINTDSRIIAATNRDLKGMMEKEFFRKDLYYRLSTIRIEVPPLRERREDIGALIDHFLDRFNGRFNQEKTIGSEVRKKLEEYSWPGNVRELLNAIERAYVLSEGSEITERNLPGEIRGPENHERAGLMTLQQMETDHIAHVLEFTEWDRAKAAEILGISERTLYRKLGNLDSKVPMKPPKP